MNTMAYFRSSVASILDNARMNKVFVEMVDIFDNSATKYQSVQTRCAVCAVTILTAR